MYKITTPEPLSTGLITIFRLEIPVRVLRASCSGVVRLLCLDRKRGRSESAVLLAVIKLAKVRGGNSARDQLEGRQNFLWLKPSSSPGSDMAVFSLKYCVKRRERWSLSTASRALLRLHSPRDGQKQSPFVNTLRPRQNGHHFSDDIFKCNFMNGNVWIPIKISLKFVPEGPINNISALVQIMAWRRIGDKPLSEPMMTQFNDAYMRHSASMS